MTAAVATTAPLEPYVQQPGERSAAFRLFALYRDMGPNRSLAKVQALPEVSVTVTRLAQLSVKRGWPERAAAWDKHLDEISRGESEVAVREMHKRHAQIGVALQTKAIEAMAATQPKDLTPIAITRWVSEGTKLERLSRGEPDTIERHVLTGDLDSMEQWRSMVVEQQTEQLTRIIQGTLAAALGMVLSVVTEADARLAERVQEAWSTEVPALVRLQINTVAGLPDEPEASDSSQ